MKKKFENMERRGLPGGPNEMFSYVTGVFSTEGYKSDSPDKNNPVNLIASGSITMEDVEFPVLGMDNLGNSKMMMPGNNYEFPGDMVLELPMAQFGWLGDLSKNLNKRIKRGTDNIKEDIRSLGDFIQGKQGFVPDVLTDNKPTMKQLRTKASYLSPKNWEYIGKTLPNYNEYNSFDDAFESARKDLGPQQFFLYDGKRHSTNYKGETADPETKKILGRLEEGLTPEQYEKFKDVWMQSQQPNLSTKPDTKDFYIPFSPAAVGFDDLPNTRKGSRPHVNLLDQNETVYQREYDNPKLQALKFLDELVHSIQLKDKGTSGMLKDLILDASMHGSHGAYSTEGTMEHEAHKKMYPELRNYFLGTGEKPDFLNKSQEGGSVSWNWKGKTYSGTLIPSMEDENNRYARTKNGKIKTLPKAQEGSENNTLSRRDLIRLIQEQNRLIQEEEERVANVRANIIPTAQRIDEADDPIPFSKFYGVEGASNKEELDAELAKLSPEIKAVLPKNRDGSIYNPAQLTFQKDGSFGVLEADDQLYCTPFGCFAYQEAGATDVPLIAGNYTFVDRAKKGTIPFEKVSAEDAEAGDMAILYADAPRQYRGPGSNEKVYRPHHTTILSDKGEDEFGPYMKAYNAIGGNVFNFSESDIDLTKETPEYYRYVGQMPSLKKRQQELIKQFSELPPEVSVLSMDPASITDLSLPVDNLYVDLPTKVTIPESNQEQKGFFDKLFGKKQLAGEISGDLLLRQVFAESSLDPNAVSPAGARGIAQFMPNTEKELQRLNLVTNEFDPLDPSQARNAQEAYMNYLSERPYLAKGSPEVQLAKVLYAYNRGPNAAKRNLSQLKNSYDIYNSLDWLEGINSESRNYINKILGKDEKFSREYENILLDSTKSDIIKLYKKFGGDVDLKRIYKNFVEGIYDNTNNQKRGKDIYDKLNRMYYREAKSAGMSIPNYVMTHIIGNS